MEELQELDNLVYDPQDYWPDLVLWTSLLLKGYDNIFGTYSIEGAGNTYTEFCNDRASQLIDWLESTSRRASRDLCGSEYFITDKLPDVCGACYQAYGLCVSGRIRFECAACYSRVDRRASKKAREIFDSLYRYAVIGDIPTALLSQLIYKYYSPNGDRQWNLISYNPLTQ